MNSRPFAVLVSLCFAATPRLTAAEVRVAATSGAALDEWSARLERMAERGELLPLFAREDTLLAGRSHERFAQLHEGVPVFGGELVRQRDGRATLTVFGTLYEGVDVDVAPRIGGPQARAAVRARGAEPLGDAPELVVLPLDAGGYRLTYRVRGAVTGQGLDLREYFVDAKTAEVVFDYSDLQTQAVGSAVGVYNDAKKISTRLLAGSYVTHDLLRPPLIKSYDLKGNVDKYLAWSSGSPVINDADLASDGDNAWTDGAIVDLHVYVGYSYDYYFKRFGRRGMDNANVPVFAITHIARREDIAAHAGSPYAGFLYCNAYYGGSGVMVFGEGVPPGWTCGGRPFTYFSAGLDVVAHEYSHGVTGYSSRLVYRNESGALNEAFSDIMGAAVEFYHQEAGGGPLRSDYLHGEDITPGGNRSLQNPTALGDPDHYSIRYVGTQDNGGVHINSGIANHAFYLAIEGGTHRLSRVAVQGVGFSNREQIERVFYRGFTSFLTPVSDFAAARAATIQAARELYGVSGTVERAVAQAWTAVGVN